MVEGKNSTIAVTTYLVGVVHLVFQRMCGRAELRHFLHLQRNIAVNKIVTHHTACLQEIAVFVQCFKSLIQT